MSDEMKVSFTVEIEGCFTEGGKKCPYLHKTTLGRGFCSKEGDNLYGREAAMWNRYKLTESCPMVKKQFEELI